MNAVVYAAAPAVNAVATKPARRLPAEVADRLLDRLCEDDAFRELFRRNPRHALVAVGLTEAADFAGRPAGGAWECLHGSGLPSKEQLRAVREHLRAQMVDSLGNVLFRLPGA